MNPNFWTAVDPPLSTPDIVGAIGRAGQGFLFDPAGFGGDLPYSLAGIDPVGQLIAFEPHQVRWTGPLGEPEWLDTDPLSALDRVYQATRPRLLPPFGPGGWVGYLAYDLGLDLDRVRRTHTRRAPTPLLLWHLYDTMLATERLTGRQWLVRAPLLNAPAPDPQERLSRWRQLVPKAPYRWTRPPAQWLGASMDRTAYIHSVRLGQRFIRHGDVYQVNLTRNLHWRIPGQSAPALFNALRSSAPGQAASLFVDPAVSVVSASPELFLAREPSGRVVTRPIKGTRPRLDDPVRDQWQATELLRSSKERAELTMIVDLERNDLNRVARPGSVRVSRMPHLASLPYVHHLVAEIEGEYPGDVPGPLLRATFPGGSITGAPKLSAMEIIDRVEAEPRGLYTGSLGYLGLDGHWLFNILIRSLTVFGNRATLGIGSGITADSNPEAEFEETRHKAIGIIDGLAWETGEGY